MIIFKILELNGWNGEEVVKIVDNSSNQIYNFDLPTLKTNLHNIGVCHESIG